MKLLVQWVSLRGGYTEPVAFRTDVVDQESDKIVGFVHAERSPATRHISLFNGKYEAEFSSPISHHECDAFAKGVEAILNHMTASDDKNSVSEEAAE
jgi:hypothetical protein